MSFDPILALGSLAFGYLLGSLPFGYLVAKANGVDIFSVGSRNPGATNVKRSVGSKAGNLVFALDFLKGAVAAAWPALSISNHESSYSYSLIGLIAAVIGHSFSIFTKFRGGKGVATMLGGLIAIMPIAALVGIGIWLALFYSTRYVSLASIGLAVSLPITNALVDSHPAKVLVSLGLAVVIVLRHRTNIVRLFRGEENRFPTKKEKIDSTRSKPKSP